MKTLRLIAALLCGGSIAGCGAGSAGVPISSVNPTSQSYAKLQFAVGTANIYGSATGLNVVSTLRQPNGQTAIGADTPKITGPFTLGKRSSSACKWCRSRSVYDDSQRRTEFVRDDGSDSGDHRHVATRAIGDSILRRDGECAR